MRRGTVCPFGMRCLIKNTMEQKYAYLSCTGQKLFNDDLMDALDALKYDIGDEADEDFYEKNMPGNVKKFP